MDKRKPKVYYLDKKKKIHTFKNQFVVNKPSYTIHRADYKKGRSRHDYDMYKTVTPNLVVNVFNLGYLAVEKNHSEQNSSVQFKK